MDNLIYKQATYVVMHLDLSTKKNTNFPGIYLITNICFPEVNHLKFTHKVGPLKTEQV